MRSSCTFISQSRKLVIMAMAIIILLLPLNTIANSPSPPSNLPRTTVLLDLILSGDRVRLSFEDKLSTEVLRAVETAERVSTVILLSDQADVSHAYEIEDADTRGWYVYRTLSEHAYSSQRSLRAYLDDKGVNYRPLWVANMIVADLDRSSAIEVASRSDVARVDLNKEERRIDDSKADGLDVTEQRSPQATEWGISNVNAPALWALGHTGEGIVVGGLDTGIRWSHNAVKSKYRGWNGTTADHNYNWFDAIHSGGGDCGPNTTAPCDDFSHGSHTLGTMIGDDGAGNQIGVAPGAKWIGCRNMNVGDGSPASYSECFQFMIAPTDLAGNNPDPSLRPHIINNSWGCTVGEGCVTRAELEVIVNNVQAAGIFVQASAGNSGSAGCSSVSQASGIYDAAFTSGAIDSNNALAGYSGRGPSTFYDPHILKPNIVAPGSAVRSIGRTSDTAYSLSSGTSMASPHVAGVVALLWSARPHLVRDIAATKALLQGTANPSVSVASQTCGGIPSTQVPNNSFGYGRVDALAAYNASSPTMISVSGRVLSPEGSPLRSVIVSLIDGAGVRRTATTSSFGIFSFDQVRGNEPYTLTAAAKRYRFAPQVVSVGGNNFTTNDIIGLQ